MTKTIVICSFVAFAIGCEKTSERCSGMNFETEPLPMRFTVAKKDSTLGTVTLDTSQNATFEPAKAANPEHLAAFQDDFERLAAAPEATYNYSDYAGDTHYKCGASVKKGAPQYPGAFKMAIYSQFYDVKEKK